MSRNLVHYEKQPYAEKGLFIYRGTAALIKGHGMCFDLDYVTTATGETAADSFGARGKRVVEVPAASNAAAFAGVLAQSYPANPDGKAMMVELYLPGSVCEVETNQNCTINSTIIQCQYGSPAGRFEARNGTDSGKGTALCLQTVNRSATAGTVLALLSDGTTTSNVQA